MNRSLVTVMAACVAVAFFAPRLGAEEGRREGVIEGKFVRLSEKQVGEREHLAVEVRQGDVKTTVTVLVSRQRKSGPTWRFVDGKWVKVGNPAEAAKALREGDKVRIEYVTEAGWWWARRIQGPRRADDGPKRVGDRERDGERRERDGRVGERKEREGREGERREREGREGERRERDGRVGERKERERPDGERREREVREGERKGREGDRRPDERRGDAERARQIQELAGLMRKLADRMERMEAEIKKLSDENRRLREQLRRTGRGEEKK